MKKIITSIFCILMAFSLATKIHAEENDVENENIENSEILEETSINDKTNVENWLEANLGWIVGIPSGTLVSIFLEFLLIAKKKRKKEEEIECVYKVGEKAENNVKQAKELVENAEKLIQLVNSMLVKNEKQTLVNNELLNKTIREFVNVCEKLERLEKRIYTLEETNLITASHTEELVNNGAAEEIAKIVKRG